MYNSLAIGRVSFWMDGALSCSRHYLFNHLEKGDTQMLETLTQLSIAVRSRSVTSSQATRRTLPGSIAWHDCRGQTLTQVFQSLRDGLNGNKSTGANSSNMEKTSQCSNLKQEIFKKGGKKKKAGFDMLSCQIKHLWALKVQSWVKLEKVLLDDICWFQEKWFESQVIYFYSSILATCGNSC